MKSINKYLNEGFFSNVGGSIDSVKKLLAPILEMNNPNRRKNLNRKVIYDVLIDLPNRFGFNIYKYNRAQTEVIESIKVTKDEDDLFWVRHGVKSGDRVSHCDTHCDTEITSIDVHPFYFANLPLKVVMTYDGDEVK